MTIPAPARRLDKPSLAGRPTTVYRYFNGMGQLLYVGITSDQFIRSRQHFHRAPWWPDIASATFEHYASREEAITAESRAIANEAPKFNLDQTPRRRIGIQTASFRVQRIEPPAPDDQAERERLSDRLRSLWNLLIVLRDAGWLPL